MLKFKFRKLVIFASVLILQPMVTPDSFALAKRRPPKAYSFFAEGGKASQGECDGERKIPRKLKHLKEYSKAGSYMGSDPQTFEIKGKEDLEMWKHYFNAKSSCNAVLAKTPSSIEKNKKDTKQELPPEESVETTDDEQLEGAPASTQEGPMASATNPEPATATAAAASTETAQVPGAPANPEAPAK